ncbi:homer protein homolog 1b isoform X1 [Archocentrus centrarchus]|uniref:homer protein homolog 1b isoform X1 n=1 Tax=Archocentrus centrarchus TaxID=63155 RepID=UPI0011E9DC49|nr:homer protein homolog 1-like isoform X1 [Archocentrus centrarchus]
MEDGELVVHLPGRSDSPAGSGSFAAGGGLGETLVLRHKEVHHFFFVPFREQPIYSTRAHVFQIDPNTKKNWLPTSKHAVTVSYFYDSTRNVYRIISLDGTKAIINSTISPNMTFTKTSQKFGQWADSRANTVYGLGFSTEHHLSKFAEKFAEYKEAARLAKEKSQEKMEMATSPSQESPAGELSSPLTPVTPPMENINGTDEICDTTPNSDARPEPAQNALAFAHSPAMTKHWEAELEALKGNNAKLTAALLESTANVKQWKQQLAAYQEEAERLHKRVTELECQSNQTPVIKSQKTELNQTIEELESALRDKEEEMEKLKEELENMNDLMEQKDTLTQKLEETELRGRVLEEQLAGAEQRLEENQEEQENFRKSLRTLLELLDGKIFELTELRDTLARLIEEAS